MMMIKRIAEMGFEAAMVRLVPLVGFDYGD